MDQIARAILEEESLVAAAAVQRLLLICQSGRWSEVQKCLNTAILERIVDLTVEGDEVGFVFVTLLAYAACDEYLRECLLDGDLGVKCIAVCSGLMRTREHVLVHEVLKLLTALSVREVNRKRVSTLLSEHPKIAVCLLRQCCEPTEALRALEVVSVFVSTHEGCAAVLQSERQLLDVLCTIPHSHDAQRLAKKIRGEVKLYKMRV